MAKSNRSKSHFPWSWRNVEARLSTLKAWETLKRG